jgi:hypothetical protein
MCISITHTHTALLQRAAYHTVQLQCIYTRAHSRTPDSNSSISYDWVAASNEDIRLVKSEFGTHAGFTAIGVVLCEVYSVVSRVDLYMSIHEHTHTRAHVSHPPMARF